MADSSLLRDLVVLFAAALPIVLIFQRLSIPSVVGFIIAGIVIGPHGVRLIPNTIEVDNLAELGLVLLLFVLGLELSFGQLARVGRVVVWSGAVQVVGTSVLATIAALAWGLPVPEAIVFGFLIVQSSTAIILKVLTDRGEVDAPYGRVTVGILLVQDLALVPMMLLTRMLTEPASASGLAIAAVLLKAAIAIALILVVAHFVMPVLLRQIVRLRSRELFTVAIVLFCLGTAFLASRLGLSLALGAFIAGLVVSESEYSHQAVADILPFRDAFNSVFFMSIGMLLRTDFLLANFPAVVAAAAGIMLFKMFVVGAGVLPAYRSLRVTVLTAMAMGGLGELSFVLARFALPSGILPAAHYEAFVAVAVLSMLASPFVIAAAPALTGHVSSWLGVREQEDTAGPEPMRNHVLIVGYGLNGENLAHVLRQTGLPYLILELDPERLKTAHTRNEPVLYGDGTRPGVLRQAGAGEAHVVVIAISDPLASRRIVVLTHQLNSAVPIIVRTRYVAEIGELQRLGATEVIPEEYETSVEIFARVLRRLRVPRNVIALQVDLIRRQGYSMLRGLELPKQTLDQLGQILAATTTESFMVPAASPASGQTIRQLQLRRATGVTIIAVVHEGTPFTNPSPDLEIQAGDLLVMLGSHAQLDHALRRLGGEPAVENAL